MKIKTLCTREVEEKSDVKEVFIIMTSTRIKKRWHSGTQLTKLKRK